MAVILKTSCTGRTTDMRFARTRAVAVADHPRSIYSLHGPGIHLYKVFHKLDSPLNLLACISMVYVYVLQLSDEKWYVGKTNRSLKARFTEHLEGKGSEWTKKYKPIRIEESCKNPGDNMENLWTKMYMHLYGIENVRGGVYTSLTLLPLQLQYLTILFDPDKQRVKTDEENRLIKSMEETEMAVDKKNLCFNCYTPGHYATNCPYPK